MSEKTIYTLRSDIEHVLSTGEGWTDENIKYNWESEELKNWYKNNANKIPHPNEGLAGVQKNDGFAVLLSWNIPN